MTALKWTKKLAPYVAAVALCRDRFVCRPRTMAGRPRRTVPGRGRRHRRASVREDRAGKGRLLPHRQGRRPFGMELRDYPMPESLNFTEMRVLARLLGTRIRAGS